MKNLLKIIIFMFFLGKAYAQNSTIIIKGYLQKVVAYPLGYSNREVDLGRFVYTFQTSSGLQTINSLGVTVFNNRIAIEHAEMGVVPIEVNDNGEISMIYPTTSFPHGLIIKSGSTTKYKFILKQICFNKLSRSVADVYFYNTTYNPNGCQGFTIKEGPYRGGDSDDGVLPRQDTMLIPNWSFFDKDGKIYALVSVERI